LIVRKAKWKKLVEEVDKFLLTDPEKQPPKQRAEWYAGTKRLLEELRRRRRES
jgi:hypothetical protein